MQVIRSRAFIFVLVATTLSFLLCLQSLQSPLISPFAGPNHVSPPPTPNKFAFATFLSASTNTDNNTNDNLDVYFVSTRVLAYQLLHAPESRTSESIPFLVLVTSGISQRKRQRLTLDGATVIPVEDITSTWLKVAEDNRWKDLLTKLRLFELVEYEKILYLDSDMLVLKSLDGVFSDEAATRCETGNETSQIKPQEAPLPSTYLFAANPDAWASDHAYPLPPHLEYFNAGFFVFAPSVDLFNYYVSLLAIPDLFDVAMMEQNLLNYAHRRDGNMPWKRLGSAWNINWPTMRDLQNGVKSLHDKFWDPQDPHLRDVWYRSRWLMEGFHQGREANVVG